MKSNPCIAALLFTGLAGISLSVSAEQDNDQQSRWGLGIGAIVQDEGYVDIGSQSNPVPIVYYESENLFLLGPTFGYKIFNSENVEFSIAGQYRFDGFEAKDGDTFTDMEDRSGTLDMGFSAEYDSDFGNFSIQFLADVLGEHKGHEISLGYSKSFIIERNRLTPYANVSLLSEDLVDYYYGVRQNEVTSNRAFYQGDATTNFQLGVRYEWQFGKNHNIVTDASYVSFGDGIKDSSLVDSSGGFNFIIGYMYVF